MATEKQAILYADGGARGNPGPAGIGAVLYDKQNHVVLAQMKSYIGEATNNQAEYKAVLMGMQKAKELGIHDLRIFLDSELVVKQMNREYKVKNPQLQQLFVRIWNLMQQFHSVTFTHIRREKNKRADALVNEAIDDALKSQ